MWQRLSNQHLWTKEGERIREDIHDQLYKVTLKNQIAIKGFGSSPVPFNKVWPQCSPELIEKATFVCVVKTKKRYSLLALRALFIYTNCHLILIIRHWERSSLKTALSHIDFESIDFLYIGKCQVGLNRLSSLDFCSYFSCLHLMPKYTTGMIVIYFFNIVDIKWKMILNI